MKTYQVRKVDKCQPALVKDLRKLGFAVECTHTLGQGRPDIIVSDQEYMLWVEIKSEGEGLTDREADWWAKWQGVRPIIAYRAEDVVEAFRLHRVSNERAGNGLLQSNRSNTRTAANPCGGSKGRL